MQYERKPQEVLESMQPAWFKDIKNRKKPSEDGRTVNEQCFDSGVFAASEFVRRLTGDEQLALEIHRVCIWHQRQSESNPGI